MDDKIIKAANTEGVDCSVISERYIKSYFEAMDKLNVQRADLYPKVTEHISDIIAMVQKLIDNGYAYELEGDVYFSVENSLNMASLAVVSWRICRQELE